MSYRPPPQLRRRESAAVYRRRRLVAALVVGAVVFVAVQGVRMVVRDDSAAVADGSSGTTAPSATTDSAATNPALPDTTGVATSETTTTIAGHSEDFIPTSTDPATLYIVGDSDAGTFGPYLDTLMQQTGVVRTVLDYKVSSGLSRPDFFDWPARLQQQLPVVNPDIVVVTFGGNDAQGLYDLALGDFSHQQPTGEPGGDQEWRAEYGKRVGAMMDLLMQDGRTVIWVGIPNDDNPEVTARMRVQDETVKAEAAKRPDLILIDTWERFAGRDGDSWAEYIIDPRDGEGKDVRADDGFHLNTVGAEILALDIAEAIRGDLRRRGAAL